MKRFISAAAAMCMALVCMAQGTHYMGRVEAGLSAETSHKGMNQVMVSTVHGVSFAEDRLFAGAGAGIGMSINEHLRKGTFPIFGDLRYSFTTLKLRPYVDLKAGYGFYGYLQSVDGDATDEGGLYVSPAFGISLPLNEKKALNIGIGYTYQRVGWKDDIPGQPHYLHTYNAGGVTFSIGLQF